MAGDAMISAEDLLARFERVERQRDGDWLVRCGAHDDGRPSLHVTLAKERWLVKCLAGCSFEAVCDAHGIRPADLFQSNGNGSTVEATYDYVDENGRRLYQVVRKPGKRFSQRRPDGNGGWIYKLGDTRRVLYRLPQVVAAVAAGETIYVVEGEKDVHALERIGLVATCNAMGAGKWRPEYSEVLKGANVVIVPDCDKPGRDHAERAAASLTDVAASVRVLDLEPGRDDGHDISDYAADAVTDVDRVELRRCIVGAAEHAEKVVVVVVPDPRETTTTTTPDRYAGRVTDLAALLAQPPQPTPWRVHGLVADGTLTIVSGESGCGKSWLAQALCSGVERGNTVAGLLCAKGHALYVDAEMGPQMFVDQRLRPAGVTSPEFDHIDAMGLDVSKPDDLAWLRSKIDALDPKFVVIDSFRRLVPSKAENDSDDMAPAVAALAKLARDTRTAILLIHHKGDGEKFYRGSTAIKDQSDALFALLRDPEDEHAPLRLRCRGGKGKMRYAPEPPDVFLTVDPEAGGVAGSDPPEDPGPVIPVREAVAAAIEAAMPAKTKTEVAQKLDRQLDDWAFKGAWGDLERAGRIVRMNGGWAAGGGGLDLDTTTTTTIETGGAR